MTNKEHPLYVTWCDMRQRCNDENDPHYRYYGGRGITYCNAWTDFHTFVSDMGERPDGYSLDRIDVNGNYCPENCQWATKSEQTKNRRLWVHNYNRQWLPCIQILPGGSYLLEMKLTTGKYFRKTSPHLDTLINDYEETVYERTFHRALGLSY